MLAQKLRNHQEFQVPERKVLNFIFGYFGDGKALSYKPENIQLKKKGAEDSSILGT